MKSLEFVLAAVLLLTATAEAAVRFATPTVCKATHCDVCTAISFGNIEGTNVRCGWCHATSQCLLGVSNAPIIPVPGCGSVNYTWGADTCSSTQAPPTPTTAAPASVPPIHVLPSPPAVDATTRSWNGQGGDSYQSYYVNETVRSVILPRTQWTRKFNASRGTSTVRGMATGGGVVIAVVCDMHWTGKYSLVTMNATTGDVMGTSAITEFGGCSVALTPLIDATSMFAYVIGNNYVNAVALPITGVRQNQYLLWQYKIPRTNAEPCGPCSLKLQADKLQFVSNYNRSTYFILLNLTSGALMGETPTRIAGNYNADCPVDHIAYSATETVILFSNSDVQAAAMMSATTGAMLWIDKFYITRYSQVVMGGGILFMDDSTFGSHNFVVANRSFVQTYQPPSSGQFSGASVLAASDSFFWWGRQDNKCTGEYNSNNGTLKYGVWDCFFQDLRPTGATIVTKNVLFNGNPQHGFPLSGTRAVQFWDAFTGAKLNWEVPLAEFLIPTVPCQGNCPVVFPATVEYHGGWLFLWNSQGIQAIAVAGV